MPRQAFFRAIVLKWRMGPVRRMLSVEFTMVSKEIVPTGMRGKRVICNPKPSRTGMFIRNQGREATEKTADFDRYRRSKGALDKKSR